MAYVAAILSLPIPLVIPGLFLGWFVAWLIHRAQWEKFRKV